MCICDYDKNRIVTYGKCFFFVLNYGISENVCQLAQNHTAINFFVPPLTNR